VWAVEECRVNLTVTRQRVIVKTIMFCTSTVVVAVIFFYMFYIRLQTDQCSAIIYIGIHTPTRHIIGIYIEVPVTMDGRVCYSTEPVSYTRHNMYLDNGIYTNNGKGRMLCVFSLRARCTVTFCFIHFIIRTAIVIYYNVYIYILYSVYLRG